MAYNLCTLPPEKSSIIQPYNSIPWQKLTQPYKILSKFLIHLYPPNRDTPNGDRALLIGAQHEI